MKNWQLYVSNYGSSLSLSTTVFFLSPQLSLHSSINEFANFFFYILQVSLEDESLILESVV